MNRRRIALAAGFLMAASLPVSAQTDDAFREGRVLFRQIWLMPPARDDADFVGLGPVYNDISCLGCHVQNGRGSVPSGPDTPLHGALVRLSVPGAGPHGGPNPHPAYGDQLNDHANPGIPAEGSARITYTEHAVVLADGTQALLRKPHLEFRNLAFGEFGHETMFSVRAAPSVLGSGILDAVSEAEILAQAEKQAASGGPVRGHPNRVYDIETGGMVFGRFGWKANQPNLKQQAAAAANGDMGLTSPLFPAKNCTEIQTECQAAPVGPQPELSAARLGQLVAYLRGLEPPHRRHAEDPATRRGEALFSELGCAQCHLPDLGGAHPYTDLLLHDLGPGLADGRPDFLAGGAEWRTAPLWGIGEAKNLNGQTGFLHDGRARTLSEAILWHGGEAQAARDAFASLPADERTGLLTFLNSL